ncbi:hypothetical protein [Streptomyces sp. NPDC001410]|uniref:hypothetical protein n=1 Tax=Streptomyces sp. NPDC001410 TaxID=3364574 RepID=UPI0036749AEE
MRRPRCDVRHEVHRGMLDEVAGGPALGVAHRLRAAFEVGPTAFMNHALPLREQRADVG